MEIYCYQNIDSLFGIFNAIVAILGSDNYIQSLAAVTVMGFVMAFLAYAFAPQKLIGWQWLATVILVYSVLLVPKMDVQLVDKTGGTAPQVVSNVPFGAAVFGSLTSSIGNAITEVFETAFQTVGPPAGMPAELSYQSNGLMFGSRLVRNAREIVILTPAFRTDLINFLANCTQYDLVPGGTIDAAAFAKSADIWGMMSSPNPGRFTTVLMGLPSATVMDCPAAYTHLNGFLVAETQLMRERLAKVAFPQLTLAAAVAQIDAAVQTAHQYNRIADAAVTADQLIVNNAMINVVNDASAIVGQRANDPSSVLLSVGRAQAVAQTNAGWITSGKVAEEALPLIRNSIEAILYALFPLVMMLLFMTWGVGTVRALKSYLMTLVWIQLWPPVYAVLNYMASQATTMRMGAAADVGGGLVALSLQTASPVYSGAISAEAVVGYLVLSVPAIAWAALKGMETVGQAALTGTASLGSTAGHAGGAAALGSPQGMGNISHQQQQLSPQRTSAMYKTWEDDVTGDTRTSNMETGAGSWRQLQNSLLIRGSEAQSMRQALETSARKGIEAAKGARVSAERAANASLGDYIMHADARDLGTQQSNRWDKGSSTDFRKALQTFQQVGKDVGLTQDQSAALVGLISGEGHLRAGIGPKALINGVRALLGGKDGLSPDQVRDALRAEQASMVGIGGRPPSKDGLIDKVSNKLGRALYAASQVIDLQVGAGAQAQAQAKDQVQTGAKLANTGSSGDRSTADDSYGSRYARLEAFDTLLRGGVQEAEGQRAEFRATLGRARAAEASLRESQALAHEVSVGRYRSNEAVADIVNDPRNTPMLERLWEEAGHDTRQWAILVGNELASQSMLSMPQRYSDGSAVLGSPDEVKAQFGADARGVSVKAVPGADPHGEVKAGYRGMRNSVSQVVPAVGSGQALVREVNGKVDGAAAEIEARQRNLAAKGDQVRGKAQAQIGLNEGDQNPGNTGRSVIKEAGGTVYAAGAKSLEEAKEKAVGGMKEVWETGKNILGLDKKE